MLYLNDVHEGGETEFYHQEISIQPKQGVVIEVNSSPGLEGIEEATGTDIAGQIIEFLETNAKVGKTKTRGQG